MQRDEWAKVKALFQRAMDAPPADREAFVERQCDGLMVRAEVLKLLRLNDESSNFLVSPIGLISETASADSDSLIGRNPGGFAILRRIGMGSMGAVYEALQEQPRRRAAVKVLRPGLFGPRMQRRFEYESETLAKLDHPGIARVFAAGTFELGGGLQPWFAMELIEGPSLAAYVRTHALSHTEKLQLLFSICDAVHHAHLCGVVHRDLKPENILMECAAGTHVGCQPKILDFGVARSIGADATATMHTIAGELVGTLAYMSPEQLSGDPEAVDVRSDVFALGVIGYELLGGQLPHGAADSSIPELIRAIEHNEPARLGAIDPLLRGDVEIIFAKTLEKDPKRRYQSAAEFAADLRRFLNDEPVLARPPTTIYQLRKFARRNRTLTGGVLTTLAVLIGGLILYAREAGIARREAEKSRYEAVKATAINDFITNDFLMRLLAPANSNGATERPPVAELVQRASEQVDTMFAGQPLAEAAVRNEIGTIHYNLGTLDQAAEQFQRALEIWETRLGGNHADTLKAVNNLGLVRARQRRSKEAESLFRRAVDGRRLALGEDDPYTLVSMNNLAELLRGMGRLDEAETLLRRALDSQRRVHGVSHKNTITTLGNLGTLLLTRRRNEEALALLTEAHDASRATLGEDDLMSAITGVRLGMALQRSGRLRDAEAILLDVVKSGERSLGSDHPEVVNARRVLARIYRQQKRYDEAADQLRQALTSGNLAAALAKKIQKELDGLPAHVSPTGEAGRASTDAPN